MFFNNKSNMFFGGGGGCCQNNDNSNCPCDPVIEPTIERCVTRDICHTVEQDYPFMSYELMINKYKLKSYYEIVFTFIITLFILMFHP